MFLRSIRIAILPNFVFDSVMFWSAVSQKSFSENESLFLQLSVCT